MPTKMVRKQKKVMVVLIASKDIPPNTEVFFYYGVKKDDSGVENFIGKILIFLIFMLKTLIVSTR